jgi:hypothetical protein
LIIVPFSPTVAGFLLVPKPSLRLSFPTMDPTTLFYIQEEGITLRSTELRDVDAQILSPACSKSQQHKKHKPEFIGV